MSRRTISRCRGRSAAALCLALAGCAGAPLIPYSADTPPLVLAPTSQVGVQDKRARFREIYCAVLEARGPELPDYRPCEDALTRVGAEPAGTGKPVDLGPSRRRLSRWPSPASAMNASKRGCNRPAPSSSTYASSGTTRPGSRSTRCPAARTTRARFATPSWPCRRRPTRRASSCSAIRRARPTFWRRWSRTRRSATASRRWSAWPARSAARRSRTARSSLKPRYSSTFRGPRVRPAMGAPWTA